MLHAIDLHSGSRLTNESEELTDEQLMENVQNGDEQSLVKLLQRHRGLFQLIHECLARWFAALRRLQSGKRPCTWLAVALARRRALNRVWRQAACRPAQNRFRIERETENERAMQPQTGHGQDDTAEAISQLIASLPGTQQQAIRLAYFHGMTQHEIAAHTGIPLGTIQSPLELAVRKLRTAALAFGELHEPQRAAA